MAAVSSTALEIPGGRMVEDEETSTSIKMQKLRSGGALFPCGRKGTVLRQQHTYTYTQQVDVGETLC